MVGPAADRSASADRRYNTRSTNIRRRRTSNTRRTGRTSTCWRPTTSRFDPTTNPDLVVPLSPADHDLLHRLLHHAGRGAGFDRIGTDELRQQRDHDDRSHQHLNYDNLYAVYGPGGTYNPFELTAAGGNTYASHANAYIAFTAGERGPPVTGRQFISATPAAERTKLAPSRWRTAVAGRRSAMRPVRVCCIELRRVTRTPTPPGIRITRSRR